MSNCRATSEPSISERKRERERSEGGKREREKQRKERRKCLVAEKESHTWRQCDFLWCRCSAAVAHSDTEEI